MADPGGAPPRRDPFSYRILHSFPKPSEERAWRQFLERADWPAHYVTPEYFLEPYWAECRPFAIFAAEGDTIAAILTGIHEGPRTISGNPCRPQTCFDPATDYSRAADALARGVLEEAGAAALVTIYSWAPMEGLQRMGFGLRTLTGTVVLDLRQGPEVLFTQLPANRRTTTRQAMRRGLEVFQASSDEDTAAYYAVHRRWLQTNRKKLPGDLHIPFPILAEACRLRDNRRLFLARHAGQIIGGCTVRFSRGGLLEGEQIASLDEYLHLHPNDLLIWKTIEWGCAEGFLRYSMNGAHPFLRRTGGSVLPVYRHQLDPTWLRRHDRREGLGGRTATRAVRPVMLGVPGDTAAPLVSVIIPTHNRADRLRCALHSICAQEGLGEGFQVEVIVVDDASSDATPDVILGYPRLRYLRLPERRGAAAAYNAGLRSSKGCYISFLDDDDEWLPHKLRVQVPLLEAHPEVGVVYSQSLVRFQGQERLHPEQTEAPSGRVFMPLLVNNFCSHHASLLARREAFDKAGDFDESLASYEDYDMSLRLAFHSRFLFAPGAVDIYNLSPQGLWLSRLDNGTGAEDAVRVIEKALAMLPDSAGYAAVKREARVRVALETARRIGDPIQAWARVVATIRAHPGIAQSDWVQACVSEVARRRALAAPSPMSAARELCAEITAAAQSGTVAERSRVRHMAARILAAVTRSASLPARP